MKEHEKLGQKQVSKVTLHFVWGHFSRKQTVIQSIIKVSFQLMSEQFRVLKGASHCILSAIAELGGESPEYFDKMFGSMDEGGAHCMRTVMYPKRAPEDIPKKSMTHTNDGRGDL